MACKHVILRFDVYFFQLSYCSFVRFAVFYVLIHRGREKVNKSSPVYPYVWVSRCLSNFYSLQEGFERSYPILEN